MDLPSEPVCRAQLGADTVAGDDGEVALRTIAGAWSGYEWRARPSEPGVLVAVADAHAARIGELLSSMELVGRANTEGARASVRPRSVDLWDDDRGLWTSIGGDGPYGVWAARDGAMVLCVVAGDLDPLDEAMLRGGDPVALALGTLVMYPPEASAGEEAADEARRLALHAIHLLCTAPLTPAGVEELERLVSEGGELGLAATGALALRGPAPAAPFEVLCRELDAGRYPSVFEITRVLASGADPALGQRVLARIEAGGVPWQKAKLDLLRALLAGNHPQALAALRGVAEADSPWRRATAAQLLLKRDPADCAAAAVLVDHLARYDALDFSADLHGSGYGQDWDDVLAAMTGHACSTHRAPWDAALERAKTLSVPSLRRLHVLLGVP